jgi:hypothetical protein
MNKTHQIYSLQLHESCHIALMGLDGVAVADYGVLRVPGGWLYQRWDVEKQDYIETTFVPFNNEFIFNEHEEENK